MNFLECELVQEGDAAIQVKHSTFSVSLLPEQASIINSMKIERKVRTGDLSDEIQNRWQAVIGFDQGEGKDHRASGRRYAGGHLCR